MIVTPLEWVLGRDNVDNMPLRRPASSQNRTLASLVERQARATGSNGQGQSSSTRGSFFDDFKKLGLPYFSDIALIAKKDNEELHQYREQQRNRNRMVFMNKKFVFGKPKEENKEDKQKPRAQGRVAMTHRDAQATSDVVYVVNKKNDLKLEDIPIVRDYLDVFPKNLTGLPLEREVDFTIDLAPRTTPISKTPYRMTPMELKELKIQL
ncbi:hypothetical protein CK203_011890 [Vitis vinifera]|uniref:Uncharacterized protein n=1 Tax=Vitis vinifera TaxID=29760 RepID=A0A438K0P6_VITVI|nr:hypothetical protein CK203_011890 [Vitis vinifera]